jgi:hypothetical protein
MVLSLVLGAAEHAVLIESPSSAADMVRAVLTSVAF